MNAEMKFSLYLSSQLMYGVIVVYSKQQGYLLCKNFLWNRFDKISILAVFSRFEKISRNFTIRAGFLRRYRYAGRSRQH